MKLFSNLKIAVNNLPRRGQHNIAKILCLSLGLAVSSVLLTQIYFEQHYDSYFPAANRTYLINERIIQNGELVDFDQTSGAIAHGIKTYSPQVEAATRYVYLSSEATFSTENNMQVTGSMLIADSCFFDIFPTKIIAGNAKEVLTQPLYCMVSETMAKKLGGNVVGKRIKTTEIEGSTLIIGGVFKDYPRNTTPRNSDVLLSLKSLSYSGFDGSNLWVGNDCYHSYIRLKEGHTAEELRPNIAKMINERLPLKDMEKAGVKMDYTLSLLSELHTDNENVKTMTWILSILALIMLFSAVMNYLLIVIGNMISRTREMAMRKSFGAGRTDIVSLIFTESLLHVILSIALAALLVYACKGSIEETLAAPIEELMFSEGSWIVLVAILTFMLIVGGLVPGHIYSSTPVTAAFRSYAQHHRSWKFVLLAIQFIASGMFCCMLLTVHQQYAMMVNYPLGYNPDNQLVIKMKGAKAEDYNKCVKALRTMPSVASVTTAENDLVSWRSGNNIYQQGDSRELLNVCDLYNVSDGYLKQMGIKIVQGRNFTEQTDSLREVMVSKKFIEKMKKTAQWDNNVVGKSVIISEHSPNMKEQFTICGVFDNIKVGAITNPEERASILFYNRQPSGNIIVKLHNITSENISEVQTQMEKLVPNAQVSVESYQLLIKGQYQPQNSFRFAIMVCGLVIVFIALLGLIGYTLDEVNRRRKEIAIRKVNGAETSDILRIFVRSIAMVALPSLTIGAVAAYMLSLTWLEQFSERIQLNPLWFVLCVVLILLLIVSVVIVNSRRVANNNPMEYLKDE